MGPFAEAGQLNPRNFPEHIRMQNSDVFEVKKPDSSSVFVFTGDLWHSSASGLKGRDWQFWSPMNFVEKEIAGIGAAVPVPETLSWIDSFELEIDNTGDGASDQENDARDNEVSFSSSAPESKDEL